MVTEIQPGIFIGHHEGLNPLRPECGRILWMAAVAAPTAAIAAQKISKAIKDTFHV